MDLYFILSQVFGGVAVVFACLSYFCSKKNFLLIQICSNCFCAIGFLFVGSTIAFVLTLINAFRCVAFYFCQKYNFKYSYVYLIYFLACIVVATALLWEKPLDIMPFLTSVMFTIIYFLKNMQLTRYLTLIPNTILSVFSVLSKAYTNALLSVVEILFTIISIITYQRKNRKKDLSKKEILQNNFEKENNDKNFSIFENRTWFLFGLVLYLHSKE